jgi:hypothetical protein
MRPAVFDLTFGLAFCHALARDAASVFARAMGSEVAGGITRGQALNFAALAGDGPCALPHGRAAAAAQARRQRDAGEAGARV